MPSELSALDYEEIRQLLARYNFAIDFGDARSWADCFSPDGVFYCTPEPGPLTGRYEGREALVAYAEQHHDMRKERVRHWNWNPEIVGDGQTATMRCYLGIFSVTSADNRPALSVTGVYRDKLAKIDGRWLFTERHIHVDPPER